MIPVPHQATCVAIKSRGLLIEGPPGSGKSTLALSLIDRGATLVGDDGVMLEVRQGRLWALPPPLITGLLEIRNVGLLNLPAEAAPIALIVQLDPSAPRLPDTVESITLHGVRIPFVRLYPDNPALALRAEWALTLHGTP
jgi:serine kinase of HPr protein (carbohydrate metabolism regulator)